MTTRPTRRIARSTLKTTTDVIKTASLKYTYDVTIITSKRYHRRRKLQPQRHNAIAPRKKKMANQTKLAEKYANIVRRVVTSFFSFKTFFGINFDS